MVELVAVTSLSVASKFNDVASPSPQELQMEGLTHMFHHKTVLEMELILLKALDWRVNSVTSLFFSQILMTKMGIVEGDIMMNRITEHLLDDLCGKKTIYSIYMCVKIHLFILRMFIVEKESNIIKRWINSEFGCRFEDAWICTKCCSGGGYVDCLRREISSRRELWENYESIWTRTKGKIKC